MLPRPKLGELTEEWTFDTASIHEENCNIQQPPAPSFPPPDPQPHYNQYKPTNL